MVAYVVPSSVTHKQVARAPKGETPAQRLHRFAAKAVIEGCRVYRIVGADRMFAVTSGTDDSIVYIVDTDLGTCPCQGFGKHRCCKHLALVLAELGELPDPEPPSAAFGLAAYELVEITCDCCHGTGRDWIPADDGQHEITCPVCGGHGSIAVDPNASDDAPAYAA